MEAPGKTIFFLLPFYLFRSVQPHTSFSKSQSIILRKRFCQNPPNIVFRILFCCRSKAFFFVQDSFSLQAVVRTRLFLTQICPLYCFQNSFEFKIRISHRHIELKAPFISLSPCPHDNGTKLKINHDQ